MILPIRDLVAFPHCSVCRQLKAVGRSSAQWSLSASVLLSDSRDAGQTALSLGAQTEYLRLGARPLEGNIWIRLDVVALVSPDWYLGQRYHFGHSSASDPHHSIRGSPLAKSDFLSLREVAHNRVRHNHVPGHCQPLTGARSPVYLLSVALITSLTFIPVRDVPTVFAPATFSLRVRPQPTRSSDGEKKKRRRSCQDTQDAPARDIGTEDTSLAAVTQSGSGPGRPARYEKTPREKKKAKMKAEEGKKARNFGPLTFLASHPSGSPPFGSLSFFWVWALTPLCTTRV